mmetsp:Transcript_100496/g.123026  ORF Transcript_100496/g.123026 Transcript_100496/m.123026 type:complete len:81 (-) Transcript_100496:16-258(-)
MTSHRGYKDGQWISHFHRKQPLLDIIDESWKHDKLFCDDIWIKPSFENKANKKIGDIKDKVNMLWKSTGLQKLNADVLLH